MTNQNTTQNNLAKHTRKKRVCRPYAHLTEEQRQLRYKRKRDKYNKTEYKRPKASWTFGNLRYPRQITRLILFIEHGTTFVCSTCHEQREPDNFPGIKGTSWKPNKGYDCYFCSSRKRKEVMNKNPEKTKANKLTRKDNSLRKKYGVTLEWLNEKRKITGNVCEICKENLEKPHVDHNHRTGNVRGLLCIRCNQGIGLFRDNPIFLTNAALYLETRQPKNSTEETL